MRTNSTGHRRLHRRRHTTSGAQSTINFVHGCSITRALTAHVEVLLEYLRFGLWWVALGVASSIGLGSGLHTFVMYLGPHIAFFTMKAMQCGRVDIKSAPYDTIQLNRSPTWLKKDCSEFGPPPSSSLDGHEVPLSSILQQVQLESILWGFGTAIGELPPYFISRAASISDGKADEIEELDGASSNTNQFKRWFLSHAQYLNFFTILLLASVESWDLSFASVWNTVIWLMLLNFFFTIITSTAQSYLKKEQEKEMAVMKKKLVQPN